MDNIAKLIPALAPTFAAGLGIQQLGELLSPLLDRISTEYKKVVFGLISLTLGLAVAFLFDLLVLNVLLGTTYRHTNWDFVITGVIISGGTEGVNSILKFMKFKKEETKNEAARKLPASESATAAAAAAGNGGAQAPAETALAKINKK